MKVASVGVLPIVIDVESPAEEALAAAQPSANVSQIDPPSNFDFGMEQETQAALKRLAQLIRRKRKDETKTQDDFHFSNKQTALDKYARASTMGGNEDDKGIYLSKVA